MQVKYDDGFFTFLNGSTPLDRVNAPATSPAFNNLATAAHPDADAINFQSIDWTSQIGKLVVGTNILAVQG